MFCKSIKAIAKLGLPFVIYAGPEKFYRTEYRKVATEYSNSKKLYCVYKS